MSSAPQKITRVVKIAVKDPSGVWNQIKDSAFSSFLYQLPSDFPGFSFTEQGATFKFDFVEDSPNFVTLVDVGADPFQRPFLYIYAVKVTDSNDFNRNHAELARVWMENALMVQFPWLLFVIQESDSFYSKQIQPSEIDPDPRHCQNICVVQGTKKKKPYFPILQQKTAEYLQRSFFEYDQESRTRILKATTEMRKYKLECWHAVLLFFYGFCDMAFTNFQSIYRRLLGKIGNSEYPPITEEMIQDHPMIDSEDPACISLTCLSGSMAVLYQKFQFVPLFDLFLQHWGSMHTTTNSEVVKTWAISSISALLRIVNFSHDIQSRLLFAQFLLKRDQQSYLQLDLTDFPHTRVMCDALIGSKSIDVLKKLRHWDTGVISTSKLVHTAPVELAPILLTTRVKSFDKLALLQQLSQQQITLTKPFVLNVHITANVGIGGISCGEEFELTIDPHFPDWCSSVKFNSAEVMYSGVKEDQRQFQTMNPEKPFKFKICFTKPGRLSIRHFSITLGKLTMKWYWNTKQINATAIKEPPTSVNFPHLTGIGKVSELHLLLNFSKLATPNTTFAIKFDTPQLVIPNGRGVATFDDRKVGFCINEGQLHFDENPVKTLVDVPILFNQIGEITETKFILTTQVESQKFEKSFDFSLLFPIECTTRLMTGNFAHICLKNTCDVQLIIESAELSPRNWGNLVLQPFGEIYLVGDTEYSTTLNIFVREVNGTTIAQTYEIKEAELAPVLEVEINERGTVGRPMKMKAQIENGFELLENDDFVILGLTKCATYHGDIEWQLIPVKPGELSMPKIKMNGIVHCIKPYSIVATLSSANVVTPFVRI